MIGYSSPIFDITNLNIQPMGYVKKLNKFRGLITFMLASFAAALLYVIIQMKL